MHFRLLLMRTSLKIFRSSCAAGILSKLAHVRYWRRLQVAYDRGVDAMFSARSRVRPMLQYQRRDDICWLKRGICRFISPSVIGAAARRDDGDEQRKRSRT